MTTDNFHGIDRLDGSPTLGAVGPLSGCELGEEWVTCRCIAPTVWHHPNAGVGKNPTPAQSDELGRGSAPVLLDIIPIAPERLVRGRFVEPLEHAVHQVAETSVVATAWQRLSVSGDGPVDR
jgi:hypothetical protein